MMCLQLGFTGVSMVLCVCIHALSLCAVIGWAGLPLCVCMLCATSTPRHGSLACVFVQVCLKKCWWC